MVRYDELWSDVRDMRNARYRALMIRELVEGRLTVDQMEVLVMTGSPWLLRSPLKKPAAPSSNRASQR